jgi:putative membrane protein
MNSFYPQSNEILASKLLKISYVVSALVLILVGVMRRYKIDLGVDFTFLPPVHAMLNSFAALFLILALFFVKKKDFYNHYRCINAAMLFSALFLLCYVLYHFTTPETKYCGTGTMRSIYFFFLITHIVLAGISLPLILISYIRGYTGLIQKHKSIVKWVFPIWLYVALTGPICYLMLRPCYQ